MSMSQQQTALLEFIKDRTGAHAIEALEFRRLTGGAIQENHGLRVRMAGGSLPGDHAFVVRSNAPASLSVSLSRWQEYEVLCLAHSAGVKVPRPYWLCTDSRFLGSEFYVMQWCTGSAEPANLVKEANLTAAQRKSLAFELGRSLARLHSIAYSAATLPFLAQPADNAAAKRISEYSASLQSHGAAHPVLEFALVYLQAHIPEGQDWVLSHCDFRTGNYLVHHGELTAILDWEFAGWSDPYEDLGWLCSKSWRFGCDEREAGGVGHKADLFAGYESISGRPVDPNRVAYWELMASVRWATIALEQSQRHLSGQQESLELALTGRLLPEIEQDVMFHLRRLLAIVAPDTVTSGGWPSGIGRSHAETGTDHALSGSRTDLATTGAHSLPSNYDSPEGAALLHVARSTALNAVLPALPAAQHYNLRMIAKAMGIAMRELEKGDETRDRQEQAIRDFYATTGFEPTFPVLGGLAQDIRRHRFSKAQRQMLFGLLDHLLDLKLALSNPRRATKHQKGQERV